MHQHHESDITQQRTKGIRVSNPFTSEYMKGINKGRLQKIHSVRVRQINEELGLDSI